MEENIANRIDKIKTIEKLIDLNITLQKSRKPILSEQECSYLEDVIKREKEYTKKISEVIDDENRDNYICPGDRIVMCGINGVAGTLFLEKYKAVKMTSRYSEQFIKQAEYLEKYNQTFPDMDVLIKNGAKAIFPIGEGGIYKTLFSIWQKTNLGFDISYKDIIMSQHTVEFSDFYDFDPCMFLSGSAVLVVCKDAYKMIESMEKIDIPVAMIGVMKKEKSKEIHHMGVASLLNRPKPDALLSVIKED